MARTVPSLQLARTEDYCYTLHLHLHLHFFIGRSRIFLHTTSFTRHYSLPPRQPSVFAPVIRTKVLEFCGFENALGSRFSSLWLLLERPFKTAVLSSSFPIFPFWFFHQELFFSPFNCLVITKVYSGIQTYRRSVSLSPLTIFFLLTALLSLRFTVAFRRIVGVCRCHL